MKDYSQFFTPADVATQMVSILDPRPGEVILEPHAGDGRLAEAVLTAGKYISMYCCEINPAHYDDLLALSIRFKLKDIQNPVNFRIADFLSMHAEGEFDGCIANPPFGRGIDIAAHIRHMKKVVKYGGKIVTIVARDFPQSQNFKTIYIDNWATNGDGTVTPIKIIHGLNI